MLSREIIEGKGLKGELGLPSSYYLDESDPDILLLRRQDGTSVGAYSAHGATREGIVEAAKEDYRAFSAPKPPST